MNNVVAIVGMAGSGKSEAARVFEANGFFRIRFGDITDEEIREKKLELNEANERYCREILRKDFGMAAYAKLNQPRIDNALKSANVVADGLYSWEEYLFFKSHYGHNFFIVAIYSSPGTRYLRLSLRNHRPLMQEESITRDHSEIENLNKGGPIAMADFTIINESSLENLQQQVKEVISSLSCK